MWWPKIGISKKHQKTRQDIDIYRIKALFNNFRRILQLNTMVFETMAELDRTLGGEFIFDSTYLEEAIRTISTNVHHVTYSLNALTANSHINIYDKYQEIRTILDDILVGNYEGLYCPPVLPLGTLSWELEPLTGVNHICLAELQHHHGLSAAPGVILTSEATRGLCDPHHPQNTRLLEDIERDLGSFFLKSGQKGRRTFLVSGSQIDEDLAETKNLGEFTVELTADCNRIHIREYLSEFSSGADPHGPPSQVPTVPFEEQTVETDSRIKGYLEAIKIIAKLAEKRLHRSEPQTGDTEANVEPPFSMSIRPFGNILACGTATTRTRSVGNIPALYLSAHLPDNLSERDRDQYRLKRLFPFDIISSTIAEKPRSFQFGNGKGCDSRLREGRLFRGSSYLEPDQLKAIAETSMTLERIMGVPVTLQWELKPDNRLVITRLFPYLEKPEEPTAAELSEEMDNAVILAEGGRVIQAGVAAGIVVHVTDRTPPEEFPVGAIAVASMATPQLTPILHRAAAILTQTGNPVGHLATVARELNLPAVFGIPNVMELLPPGKEITIDSGMCCVFEGLIKSLVQLGYSELAFSPVDPEYRILRRLLRFISPLNLIDPESENFSAEQCRTYHDIIHYCHEMAVDELAHFQERRPEIHGLQTTQMQLPRAMTINLLDIGDGLAPDTTSPPGVTDINCEPFAVFVDGLLHPRAPGEDLPSLGMKDLVSSIPKTFAPGPPQQDTFTGNLAIISHNYLNLSLRLGYHFSVVDAHLSNDRHRNYIYFRFIGGMAEAAKRERRAKFIETVLQTMDFKVERTGDLVVGRIKFEHKDILRSALFVLGALTTFTRQRDTALDSEEQAARIFRYFADTFLLSFGSTSVNPPEN